MLFFWKILTGPGPDIFPTAVLTYTRSRDYKFVVLTLCRKNCVTQPKARIFFFSGARFSAKKRYRKEGTFDIKMFRYTNTVMCISNLQY